MELEARFGRHTWTAYQSHLRDNLDKNKNYGPQVHALRHRIGIEGLKACRARLLSELPNAKRGPSLEQAVQAKDE